MVRTTLGAEVETDVSVQGAESVDFLDVTQTTDVQTGDRVSTIVRSPPGTIYELVAAFLFVSDPGGTSSGSHTFLVRSERLTLSILSLESDGVTQLQYKPGTFDTANVDTLPKAPTSPTENIRGARLDDTNGLEVLYINQSGATQTRDRTIRLWVREIQVGD